jgi:hypothetical protein
MRASDSGVGNLAHDDTERTLGAWDELDLTILGVVTMHFARHGKP